MSGSREARRWLAVALALLVATPLHALATPPQQTPSTHVDIALAPGGILRGYVVDGGGVAVANAEVLLQSPHGQQVATRSDNEGRFGYQGVTGGTYQLATEYGEVACRAWTPQGAPPRSSSMLLLVHDEQIARGQWGPPPTANGLVSNMKGTLSHPLAVAAIIGAAVAIPVAIHNADKDDSGS